MPQKNGRTHLFELGGISTGSKSDFTSIKSLRYFASTMGRSFQIVVYREDSLSLFCFQSPCLFGSPNCTVALPNRLFRPSTADMAARLFF